MARKFDVAPARRTKTPILIGIVGASGTGKTKSALRLCDGMARVIPGPTAVIDTEARRAAQHAGEHSFLHIPFAAPFGPLDYIEAIQAALEAGAKRIIIDSVSHEHEGPGGMLERHEDFLEERCGADYKKRERMTMAAWIKPKAEHNRMKQFILQQEVDFIFCFRAKEKIKPVRGGEPMDLGWQALGAPDLIYEMLVKILLFPGADGTPTWRSEKMGEQQLMKLPGWFRDVFAKPRQLDEDIGEALARWAVGADVAPAKQQTKASIGADLGRQLAACRTPEALADLEAAARKAWRQMSQDEQTVIKGMIDAARERVASAVASQGEEEISDEEAAEILRQEAGQ